MMKVEIYPLGPIQTNCYVAYIDNHAVIIDPGSSSRKIVNKLKDEQIIVDAILLTHGHFDHIGGVDYFADAFDCPIYIHEEDKAFLTSPELNCSRNDNIIVQHKVQLYDYTMQIGEFTFSVDNLPGHTNGSCFLVFDDIIFAGDVLFKDAIGRYDLPSGSRSKTTQSIEHIKQYTGEYTVYPGHGEATTLKYELQHNPYFI